MFVFKGTAAAEASKHEREWRVTDHYNIQQLGKHPFHTMLQPSLHHRSLTEDARRPSLPQPRSRSTSSIAVHSLHERNRPSPTPSADRFTFETSTARRSSSSGSIHKRVGSSDSFGKTLMAKGSRLLRRQTSKHDLTPLQTLEWLEDVKHQTADRPASKPSPIRHDSDDASPRYNISEPFNFHHLTHTTPQQVEKIQKTSYGGLISEFSAIRASQKPHRKLRGIKTRNIQQGIYSSEASMSETASPPYTGHSNSPPGSPAKDHRRMENHSYDLLLSGRNVVKKTSIENFSQPSPSYYTAQSSPTSPPPRSSSRIIAPDFFAMDQEPPVDTPLDPNGYPGSQDRRLDTWKDGSDDLALPHAVTTPDDTAHALRPPPFSLVRTELAGVPEEDEISEGKRNSLTTSIVCPAILASSVRHAKSFPSTRLSPSRRSGASSSTTEAVGERSLMPNMGSAFTAVPSVEEHIEEVPLRPRSSRRMSLRKEESWEDVIDYCYEHEAEADCNFDWELASHFEEETIALSDFVAMPSNGGEDGLDSPVEANESIHTTPEGHTAISERATPTYLPSTSSLVPSQNCPPETQSPTADSVESSFSSISEAVTPLPVGSSMTAGLSRSNSNSKDWASRVPTPLIMPEDTGSDYAFEDFYQKMLTSQAVSNNQLLFSSGRIDGSTISNSPRSSHSPISKSNSQESFLHSQIGASACRHRNTGSVGSLPELVHSKSNDKPDNVSDQLVNQTVLLAVSDTPMDGCQHQRRPSLAKDVALKSILSKVATSEVAEGSGTPLLLHPAFRDRASSDTPQSMWGATLAPGPQGPIPRRMRSPSSASSLSSRTVNRASYSLFPSCVTR